MIPLDHFSEEPGCRAGFNDHLGLNLFDYGARLYDAAVGRWFVVDPLAELPSQIAHSPYIYAWNNPVGMIDPTGMAAEESDPGKKGKKEDPPPGWNDGPVMEGVDVTAKRQYGPPDFRSMHWDNQKAQTGWVDEKGKQGSRSDDYGNTVSERVNNPDFWLNLGHSILFGDQRPGEIHATVPDLPIGPGGPVRILKYAKNPKKLIVIGEDMAERVIPYAKEINAKWFKPIGQNSANWMRNQVQWIRRQIKDPGTTIIDIGPKGATPVSPYYKKELEIIKKWLGL